MAQPTPEEIIAARYGAKAQAVFEAVFVDSIIEWEAEQRANVLNEGYAKGRADQVASETETGRQQGHKEGFDIGRAQGFAQGYEDGLARGSEEGHRKAAEAGGGPPVA